MAVSHRQLIICNHRPYGVDIGRRRNRDQNDCCYCDSTVTFVLLTEMK
ncbi:hypothetical protein BURPS668_2137 [Burkholderia pseudomallei 668]|nr:hypothetical protein BURPS668_2137 [Burkholderia pseudomallei 668]